MKRLVSLLAWVLLAPALVAAALSLLICVFVLAFGVLSHNSLFFFPGDPPILETLLFYSFPPVVLFSLLSLFLRQVTSAHAPRLRAIVPLLLIVSAAFTFISVSGIAFRFTPQWAAVRDGIRGYGDTILRASGRDKDHVLTPAEFASLRSRILPEPVPVSLPGFGTVHLRMAHYVYPFVGIDFGEGRNARFDPLTMFCTYSD